MREFELFMELSTALYLETMPNYDPTYDYSYAASNMKIPVEYQSVEAWLNAIAIHMKQRSPGHGGGFNVACVLMIPSLGSDKAIDNWLKWTTDKLKKEVLKHKKRVKK